MKKLLLGWVACVAVAAPIGSAFAADMPLKAAPPAVAYAWSGCYLGVNAGGGSSHIQGEFLSPVTGSAGEQQDSGFLAGGQVGCDQQLGSIVVGARGLWDWSSLRGQHVAALYPDFTVENRIPWVATVVGRIGVLIQPASMLYVVGGAAWKRNESRVFFVGGGSKLLFEEANSNRDGWLVGGGYEGVMPPWWLGANWSWFVEYNYMDFGKKDVQFILGPAFGGPQFIADLIRIQQTSHVVLLGLNYRFNFGAPILTRY